MKLHLTLAAVAAATLSSIAAAQPITERDGVLADAGGRTLYTFDKDASGKSACYGDCATAWPPLLAKDGDQAKGDFGLTKRDDGAMQWTHKSKPLYYFAADTKPGQRLGDGQGGVWHVIAAGGKPARAASSSSSGSPGFSVPGY